MTDQIKELQQEIAEWADSVPALKERTWRDAMTKMMMEEIPELITGGCTDPMEFADVAILLFDAAALQDIDIVQAMRDKMAVNRERIWEVDEFGTVSHVEVKEAEGRVTSRYGCGCVIYENGYHEKCPRVFTSNCRFIPF